MPLSAAGLRVSCSAAVAGFEGLLLCSAPALLKYIQRTGTRSPCMVLYCFYLQRHRRRCATQWWRRESASTGSSPPPTRKEKNPGHTPRHCIVLFLPGRGAEGDARRSGGGERAGPRAPLCPRQEGEDPGHTLRHCIVLFLPAEAQKAMRDAVVAAERLHGLLSAPDKKQKILAMAAGRTRPLPPRPPGREHRGRAGRAAGGRACAMQ